MKSLSSCVSQYQAHIARTFELLGETQVSRRQRMRQQCSSWRQRLPDFAQQCGAARSCQPVPQDGPGESSTAARRLSASFNFCVLRNTPPVESLNVTVPAYFAGLNQLAWRAPAWMDWKTYLRWALIRHLPTTALPQALDQESFDFYGKVLEGQPEQKPRWKRCVAATDDALGEALGQVYVEQRFSAKDKQRTLELTHDVEAAMGRDIEQLSWMSADHQGSRRREAACSCQ